MHHTTLDFLRAFIADYGYWAVALALLSEGAGIPVPGEITLLLAGFVAYSEHRLHLGWIIVVATAAATLGGNLGYAIGQYGGRPLLERYQSVFRISPATLKRGEEMFERHGAIAIFSPASFSAYASSPDRWPAFSACAGKPSPSSTSWVQPRGSRSSPAPDISSANTGATCSGPCSASISRF
jgi:membrane protein YqaA with SNARE-associated domain